ncbi:hypothetical protein R3P38DRAFT_475581 [Favolaschia claudopus]|uniref:Uncharacterized protein n=1 Tax=Favolaschia claudopus TaxID=2862362 RepID=A0AAW0CL99_9AGAR
MSRQVADSPAPPTTHEDSVVESLLEQLQHVPSSPSISPQDSSSPQEDNHHRRSNSDRGSGYYPSWLPKRPPPPGPASTMHSERGTPQAEVPPEVPPFVGGRKATPRSVRIVSLQEGREREREPTDQTRVGPPSLAPRVWSRGMGTPVVCGSTTRGSTRRRGSATVPCERFTFRVAALTDDLDANLLLSLSYSRLCAYSAPAVF